MAIMKYYLCIGLLISCGSTSAFIGSMVRFIVGGACIAGALYEAQQTQREYEKAQNVFSQPCAPITLEDFDDLEKLDKKCYCIYKKYDKALLPGALTVILGGFGTRCFLKGIIR
jgi:hypothetical protein